MDFVTILTEPHFLSSFHPRAKTPTATNHFIHHNLNLSKSKASCTPITCPPQHSPAIKHRVQHSHDLPGQLPHMIAVIQDTGSSANPQPRLIRHLSNGKSGCHICS